VDSQFSVVEYNGRTAIYWIELMHEIEKMNSPGRGTSLWEGSKDALSLRIDLYMGVSQPTMIVSPGHCSVTRHRITEVASNIYPR
jgi:hypothetical protein